MSHYVEYMHSMHTCYTQICEATVILSCIFIYHNLHYNIYFIDFLINYYYIWKKTNISYRLLTHNYNKFYSKYFKYIFKLFYFINFDQKIFNTLILFLIIFIYISSFFYKKNYIYIYAYIHIYINSISLNNPIILNITVQ